MTATAQGRRRRGRPATVSTRVLETTERLLAEGQRYGDLSVETLLTEADVSRSSFYANFADKQALLRALAERALSEIAASGVTWWRSTHELGPEAASTTVQEIIRTYRAHAPLINAVVEAAASDPGFEALWRGSREAVATRIAGGIKEEQRAGLVPADLDVDRTASYVTLLVDTAVLDHVRHGSPRNDRAVADAIARMGWLAYYAIIPE